MSYLSIELEAVKGAIAFPDFHSDDLLEIALIDLCTLNEDAAARTEIMRLAERQAGVFGSFTRRTYLGDAPWDKKASADL